MAALDLSLVGKRVSLISCSSDVRYTGILTGSDPVASTIQLSNVYSMGTELRRPPDEYIPAATELYTYIIFRASEVKDIAVDEPANHLRDVGEDPAVIGLQVSEPQVTPNHPPDGSPSYSQQTPVGVSPQPGQDPVAAHQQQSFANPPTAQPEPTQALVYDPEAGWDDGTDPHCTVLQYGTDGQEVETRVVFTAKMVALRPAAHGAFFFQKVFGDGYSLGSGQLVIPPNSAKPAKSTKDNAFVFYVIQGAVNVSVHQSSFIVATGGMFWIPRGNLYNIQNVCERDAKLFFTQVRSNGEEVGTASGSDTEQRTRSTPAVDGVATPGHL